MVGVRQFDEAKLLATVLDVFWRKGWQATSMSDLAEASGVQRGSLYNAYGGKEALFLLAFESYAQRFLADVRTAIDAPSAAVALNRFFDVAIANMTAGHPPRGCLTTKMVAESEAAGELVQARLRQLLNDLRTIMQSALAIDQIRAGLKLSPEETAEILVTFTRGLAIMEALYHSSDQLRSTSNSLARALLSTRIY
ncbi:MULTISPECIES: TetR/AcrR family transcriptional regulator [Xanthobacter]|uniref:TetR/AcrR family transcriptional regulator n=1 Tax=Xanthobacter TaxID=279 RepID=UPI001F47B790|nr:MULTISPECIES: TetR/AcrR family transcriptional regulator [unclassified Xanthobacter]